MNDKEELLQSAGKLKPASLETYEEYKTKRNILVGLINEKMEAREDLQQIIGGGKLEMMKDNHGNHAQFIESILYHYESATLVDTVLWVYRTYLSHGFSQSYWNIMLNAWLPILHGQLSAKAFREIKPFYEWMIDNHSLFISLSAQRHD